MLSTNSGVVRYIYVDNLGYLGADARAVQAAQETAAHELDKVGLMTHEAEPSAPSAMTLGVEIDGREGFVQVSGKRMWEVRFEHTTLWTTVRAELEAARALLPLAVAHWRLPWCTTVSASDACETGYGVVESSWPESEVSEVGRLDERSRYRLKNHAKDGAPRAMALGAWRDALSDPLTVFAPAGTASPEAEWLENPEFKEIAGDRVGESDWKVVYAGRYLREETMHVLEAKCDAVGSPADCEATGRGHEALSVLGG